MGMMPHKLQAKAHGRRILLLLALLAATCPCFALPPATTDGPISQYALPELDTLRPPGDSAVNFYPGIIYLPGTGFVSAGYLSLKGLLSDDDKLEAYGAASFGPQSAFKISYTDPGFRGSKLRLRAWADRDNFDKNYYGRGNETLLEEREAFLPGFLELGVSLARELGSSVTFEAAVVNRSWDLTLPQGGDRIPSWERDGGRVRALRLDLLRDTRNDPIEPRRGGRDLLRLESVSPLLGSDFGFSRLELQVARFRPVNERQVLALRAEYAAILGGEAPFFELPRLGGANRLRGAKSGRYRANSSLLFGAEWRLRLSRPLSFAAFGEAGKVWDDADAVPLTNFHATGGVGLRYRVGQGMLVRMDLAVASSGLHSPLFAFCQAF
jgi:outer membrane protein assembly factor BamA